MDHLIKILLINPATENKYCHIKNSFIDNIICKYFNRFFDSSFNIPTHSSCTTMPPVTLYGLEALVDDSCLVEIIDEQVTPIDFSLTPDLIFITATTTQINRAKEISEVFRSKGIKTVIGGVHASSLPQDCQDHFDVVCVGEAEDYLEQLIADFINSKLSSQYLNRNPVDMNKVPFYNYEIGNGRYLPFHVINFSRGCSFSCDFCSIQSTLGGYRTRDVTSIVGRSRYAAEKKLK